MRKKHCKLDMRNLLLSAFTLTLILLNGTESSKLAEENLAKAIQIQAEAYKLLDQPCNREAYTAVMPAYWRAFFEDVNDNHDLKQFEWTFWNVSIYFKPGETTKTVMGYEPGTQHEVNIVVNKAEQEAREASICSAPGGLMECRIDGKCNCLTDINITDHIVNTTRVNHKTGAPDPNGTVCFVQEGKRCLVEYVSQKRILKQLEFPCVYFARCLLESQLCDMRISAGHRETSSHYFLDRVQMYVLLLLLFHLQ